MYNLRNFNKFITKNLKDSKKKYSKLSNITKIKIDKKVNFLYFFIKAIHKIKTQVRASFINKNKLLINGS